MILRLLVCLFALTAVASPIRVFAQAGTRPAQTYACRFACVGQNAAPNTPGVIGDVRVSCTGPTDTSCAQACETRCQTYGPTGNGLSVTQGSNLRCGQNPPPACVAVAPANAGGSVPVTQQGAASATYDLPNPLGTTDLPVLFGRIVRAFLGVLGALALFWFVWGGILWMTAEESKRTEDAKTVMRNATIGMLIIFFAYGFTTMFLSLFQEIATPAVQQTSVPGGQTAATPQQQP